MANPGSGAQLSRSEYETAYGKFAALTSEGRTSAGTGSEGKDSVPTVLMIHSTGTSKRLFADVIERLPEFRCIAVDILGHGDSDRPPFEFSVPDHGTSLIDLVERIRRGREPILVASCSFGAVLTIELASRAPRLVSGILVNGAPGWHLESQRMARLRPFWDALLDGNGMPRPGIEMGGTVIDVSQSEHEARQEDVRKAGRWLLNSAWGVCAYDIVARLPRIKAVTTILMGSHDGHLPTSYTLADGIDGAVHEVVPNAGHLLPYDQPQRFADAVRALWKRVLDRKE